MKLSAEQARVEKRLRKIDPDIDFFWDEETGSAKFIKGKLTESSSDDPESIARTFLRKNRELLDLQDGLRQSLKVEQVDTDRQGHSHVYFSQSLNGVPVYEGSTQVHINPAGEVIAYKDYRLASVGVALEPRIEEQQAIDAVLSETGISANDLLQTRARLILFRDAARTVHLAWEVEWITRQELAVSLHIIDAHDGSLLYKHSRMKDMASRLTYSAENTSDLKKKLVLQDNQSSTDAVAQAAHDHARIVHDYFFDTFGRNSYDDRGADLVSTVHYREN